MQRITCISKTLFSTILQCLCNPDGLSFEHDLFVFVSRVTFQLIIRTSNRFLFACILKPSNYLASVIRSKSSKTYLSILSIAWYLDISLTEDECTNQTLKYTIKSENCLNG